jgi:HEPN domain-containing protein
MNKADLVRQWFDIASEDLRSAAFLFDNMNPKPVEIICYHCQQAVEKVMKGYLIDQDTEPPYIHDLEKLLHLCTEYDPSFDTLSEPCRKLTNYASAARYPSLIDIVETDAVLALKEADRIYAFCADLIPELLWEQT